MAQGWRRPNNYWQRGEEGKCILDLPGAPLSPWTDSKAHDDEKGGAKGEWMVNSKGRRIGGGRGIGA